MLRGYYDFSSKILISVLAHQKYFIQIGKKVVYPWSKQIDILSLSDSLSLKFFYYLDQCFPKSGLQTLYCAWEFEILSARNEKMFLNMKQNLLSISVGLKLETKLTLLNLTYPNLH